MWDGSPVGDNGTSSSAPSRDRHVRTSTAPVDLSVRLVTAADESAPAEPMRLQVGSDL